MTEQLLESVKSKYGAVAESSLSNDHAGVQAVAEAFGYTAEELTWIPADANMGLSCGNPTATAHLRRGEVVVDLGSGGGLEVFLASKQVGPEGRAIGIDRTLAMVERAEVTAKAGGYTNVEFYHSTIDHGRLCRFIAGAIRIDNYRDDMLAAGFEHVEIVDSGADLNAYAKVENQAGCCSPAMTEAQPGHPLQIVGTASMAIQRQSLPRLRMRHGGRRSRPLCSRFLNDDIIRPDLSCRYG